MGITTIHNRRKIRTLEVLLGANHLEMDKRRAKINTKSRRAMTLILKESETRDKIEIP